LGWGVPLRRLTRDIDFQGLTENSIEGVVEIIKEICLQPIDPSDGMTFNADTVVGLRIMETGTYQGVRISFLGRLGVSTIYMYLDISFGNVVTPSPLSVELKPLLGLPTFQLSCYTVETAIAEKFHAITVSGMYNDRWKDYYDIWLIKNHCSIEGDVLQKALVATFHNRDTPVPPISPKTLTTEFAASEQQGWSSFLRKNVSGDATRLQNFSEIMGELIDFLLPVLQSIARRTEYAHQWVPGVGWKF
jgi:hypothetical protein